jgi:heme-binding protein
VLVLAFVATQFVPYGRDHVNPPVGAEPTWDSPGTRTLAKQACFDCHSNETEWPAYSRVARSRGLFSATSPKGAPC